MTVINVFTIRNKTTQEIIYAEGVLDCDTGSDFRLESKWITKEDKSIDNFYLDYRQELDCYSFSGDVDMLCQMNLKNICFSLEEYEFDSLFSLKHIG